MKNFFTEQIMYRIMTGFIALMFLTIAYNYYLQFYPFNIEKVYDQSALPILNKDHIIKQGDTIHWQAHYEIYKANIRTEYAFFLESPTNDSNCEYKILIQGKSVTKIGDFNHVSGNAVVPADFKPCVYRVRIESIFYITANRLITVTSLTENFTVISK